MAVSTESTFAKVQAFASSSKRTTKNQNHNRSKSMPFGAMMNKSATPRGSSDASSHTTKVAGDGGEDGTADFTGDLDTNNDLPSRETLRKIEDFPILDQDGKAIPFKNLYTGPNVARRILVIFIRHFFCGNCQEYVRSLNTSISTNELLKLPTPTFIAIIGHGDPSLIPMYQAETNCPFPIYADPTKKLYNELGMLRTLNLGVRPEYQRRELISIMAASFIQSLKSIKGGLLLKGGDYHQVGGEFLFEPVNLATPMGSLEEESKQIGEKGVKGMLGNEASEEKHVTWCHRMRNTRDHAEIPELREILGLDGQGVPGKDSKRWTEALSKRKGTGFSSFSARTDMNLSRRLDDSGSSGRPSSEAPPNR